MRCNPDKQTRVVVVSLPGMMQNLLRETFDNRFDADVVGVASGGLSAVNLVQQKEPDLVVIDSNIPDVEVNSLVFWLKEEYQQICVLVLVETTNQSKKLAKTGADIILRSYSLPEGIDRVLENMKPSRSDK